MFGGRKDYVMKITHRTLKRKDSKNVHEYDEQTPSVTLLGTIGDYPL